MKSSLKYGCLSLMLLLPCGAMAQEVDGSLANDSARSWYSEVMTAKPADVVHGDQNRMSGIIDRTTYANSSESIGQGSDYVPALSSGQGPGYGTTFPSGQGDSLSYRAQLTASERQTVLLQGYAAQERRLDVPDMVGWRQGGDVNEPWQVVCRGLS